MRQIPFYFFINLNPNEIKQSDIKEKNFMMKHNLLDFHFFSNFVDFITKTLPEAQRTQDIESKT